MIYKGGVWSSDDNVGMDEEEGSISMETTDNMILEEADTVLKNFRKLDIDWMKELEEITTEEVEICDDLMPLNPGKLYLRLQEKDLDRKTYGLMSLIAAGSKGAIVFLPALSFYEHCNSI